MHFVSSARTRAQIGVAALWLALSPAVAIGFGRFAYALVLPAMKADLGWTYRQAGLLNTANALGYLLGALLAAPILQRVAARTALLGGLAMAILSLALAGATREYSVLLAARALVGTAAAFTFISATTLAASLGESEDENALALGISISGPGFGTVATGAIVPFVLNGDAAHWPRAWWMMSAIGAVLMPLIFWTTRTYQANASTPQAHCNNRKWHDFSLSRFAATNTHYRGVFSVWRRLYRVYDVFGGVCARLASERNHSRHHLGADGRRHDFLELDLEEHGRKEQRWTNNGADGFLRRARGAFAAVFQCASGADDFGCRFRHRHHADFHNYHDADSPPSRAAFLERRHCVVNCDFRVRSKCRAVRIGNARR